MNVGIEVKNMSSKNIEDTLEYQAYIERLSSPLCPQKITEEELQLLKKRRKDAERASYNAFLERISAPPCPRKLTEAEVEELRKKGRIK